MRKLAVLVLLVAFAGCGSTGTDRGMREARCQQGLIHDQACREQKNREAAEKEAETREEVVREAERLAR